jgi:hypothetical protein
VTRLAGDVGEDRGVEPGFAELAENDRAKFRDMQWRRSQRD